MRLNARNMHVDVVAEGRPVDGVYDWRNPVTEITLSEVR
jgi:hypothetical protein